MFIIIKHYLTQHRALILAFSHVVLKTVAQTK